MDKSILEKRIHEKAEERADKKFEMIRLFFRNEDELVNQLVLKTNSKENLIEYTNWQDIRKKLVEKYEKEETDNILSKLDSINYLLEGK